MLNLYTETAFQVTPVTPASVVHLRVHRQNGTYNKTKFSSSQVADSTAFFQDEQSYTSHVLASQSSIFFRESKSYPRTYYWKVVSDGKVLEVCCSDLARSEGDTKEAYFTLRFEFEDQIAFHGVTFTDLANTDEIHAFVHSSKNEIFELRIPTEAFRDPGVLHSENQSQWSQAVDSSSLGIDTVHRVYASSPLIIFISFASGRIQRLRRKSIQEQWTQDNYDDRSWRDSFRGLVGSVQLVEHGSNRLDPRTAQAMRVSADGELLFTVCLNYTLRIWHLKTGRILATKQLLQSDHGLVDGKHLAPAQDAVLHLFKPNPTQKFPTVLTFSPQDGQFKFWTIKGSLTDSVSVEDQYPNTKLSPPDPDPDGHTVWSVVDFKLDPGSDYKPAGIWVLWRNHNYHQLYHCQLEFGSIATSWKLANWVKCNSTTSTKSPPPDFVHGDQEDPTSKWLEFFFRPGHYSAAGLETALHIFEQGTGAKSAGLQKSAPLRQRLCSVVAVNVSLRKYSDSDMDFDRFSIDTDAQWRNFHRIAENVNENRNAALTLAYDAFGGMLWIAMADKCCAVRECSKIELLQQNELGKLADLEETTAVIWSHRKVSAEDGEPFTELAVLVHAARAFRRSLSASLALDLKLAIEEDISVGNEHITPTRLLNIYDSIGFGEAVSNDVVDKLEADLSSIGGISGLNNELFLGLLELIAYRSKKSKSALRNTLFAHLLLSAGVLGSISAQQQLLTDLLTLAIFVEGELSPDEARSTIFDAAELYDQIAPLLRLCERNLWLTSHTRRVPVEILGLDGHPNASRQRHQSNPEKMRVVTIFEDTLSKAVRPQPAVEKPLMYLITDQLSEIDDWASGKDTLDPDDGAVFLQCDLLKQDELDLATDFLKFQPSSSWSSYVKGRLALKKGDYDMAAYYFRKASYGLACGKAVGNLVALSAGILSMIEAERFNNGLPTYLYQITDLFDSAKAHNESAYFAHLTLGALPAGRKEPFPNFRMDVLSRLFTAELHLTRFDRAYATVVQMSDIALQRSSVNKLIAAVLDPTSSISGQDGAVRLLQCLPWAMYPHLARQMNEHLDTLSRSQPASTTGSSANRKTDYLAIMHAVRVSQKDHRGAVTVLHDRLRLLRKSGRARHDPQGTALRHVLLSLINLMACVDPEEAYIIVDVDVDDSSVNGEHHSETRTEDIDLKMKKRRRAVVTLDDLRKEYQALLDKCSRIERGDFDFEVDDEEEDQDGDETMADQSQSRLNLSKTASGNGVDAMEF